MSKGNMSLTKPTIHVNGTSREELYHQLLTASSAVRGALSALAGAAPHARDYYSQESGSYPRAHAEHSARVQKLVDVREELYELLEHVSDAQVFE